MNFVMKQRIMLNYIYSFQFADLVPVVKMSKVVDAEIRIELIEEEDTEEVLSMLKEFFFKVFFSFQVIRLSRCNNTTKKNFSKM